jgi:hypothetical protein
VTRLNTKRITQMRVATVRGKCRPTFMCATINTKCMGAAVMGGRDAERAGCITDKLMRWAGGRWKHFHGVLVESKARVQQDGSIAGVLLVGMKTD